MDDPGTSSERPGHGRGRVLAGSLLAALAGLAAGFGLQIAALAVAHATGIRLSITQQIAAVIVLTQGVAFGGVALLYFRGRRGRLGYPQLTWPAASEWAIAGLGWTGAVVAVAFGGVLSQALGLEAAPHQLGELGLEDPEIFLFLIPLSFVLIAPGEELLFRGVIQRRLRRAFGPVAAVVIASAIFAGVHVIALSGSFAERLVSVSVLFLPSLVMGAVYERTGNLAVPILVHGAYNATLFAAVYAAAGAA